MKPSPRLAHRVIEGQAFVMDARESTLYSFNGTATFIWKELAAGRSPEEIAESLAEAYDVEPAEARADVREFLARLAEAELVGEA